MYELENGVTLEAYGDNSFTGYRNRGIWLDGTNALQMTHVKMPHIFTFESWIMAETTGTLFAVPNLIMIQLSHNYANFISPYHTISSHSDLELDSWCNLAILVFWKTGNMKIEFYFNGDRDSAYTLESLPLLDNYENEHLIGVNSFGSHMIGFIYSIDIYSILV